MRQSWFFIFAALFTIKAWANPQPLFFQAWKDQQILEAQNQVLRVSARINTLKSGKALGGGASQLLPSSKVKSADPMASAEKDLKRSQESLANAQNLTFDDYVAIYIPTLYDQPEVVAKLAEKLSREELADIFQFLMRQPQRNDAKRNGALLGALGSSRSAQAN